MPSDRDIRLRIRSVRNIEKITKAMKMVAAARIRKVEALARASRPYARRLQEVVAQITAQAEERVHPLMQTRPVEKVGVLILGVIQSLIVFDGTLSSWWTRIAVGVLLCLFCLLQRLFERGNLGFLFGYWKKPDTSSPAMDKDKSCLTPATTRIVA